MTKRKARRIGLTGGIASGKTTIARLFSILQVPVYSSDKRAKEIILHHPIVKSKIVDAFGEKAYHIDGSYNHAYIASIVFNDKEQLALLNSIVHPAVFEEQEKWFNNLDSSYGIIESALLFEANKASQFDSIIVVASDDKIRVNRIQERDQISREEAKKRLESQIPQAKKIELADYVIWNNGKESIIKQVMEIHQDLN